MHALFHDTVSEGSTVKSTGSAAGTGGLRYYDFALTFRQTPIIRNGYPEVANKNTGRPNGPAGA